MELYFFVELRFPAAPVPKQTKERGETRRHQLAVLFCRA
jgi:hypothetical protein